MKLVLKEPTAPRYIYINPQTNRVHLLMPIMSGTEIGLDNTCKSVLSLQEFFGLLDANKQSTAPMMLKSYQEALEFDLKYQPDSEEKELKKQRLQQINTYLTLINQIKEDAQINNPLKRAFPVYPAPLESLMQTPEANLYSIILRSQVQDLMLRTTAITPVFSTHHDRIVDGLPVRQESLLYETLATNYQRIQFQPKSKKGLIDRVVLKLAEEAVNFERIKTVLSEEVREYLGFDFNFDRTKEHPMAPSVEASQAYLDEQIAADAENPATHKEYIEALLEYCAPNLFDAVDGSPFYSINDAEKLSVLTQFFLAELNIVCRAQELTAANFGQILENNAALINELTTAVKTALEQSASVEEALIHYVNQHQQDFQLTNPFSQDSIPKLKERFRSHCEQIKGSPHFDEFMLLSEKKGAFFAHQGCIATHFARFLQTGFFDEALDEPTQAFLNTQQQDFETVEKPENTIPHKNTHLTAEINLDLSLMDKEALRALYAEINTYEDPKVKEALLAQFLQERPDFKPPINVKPFLQLVAYGKQNEAEALLQINPELAQELLTTHDIPFTDYSGRTFTCTAYEYAYWAKDAHMMRMLEKYMDEDTKEFILERIKTIEEPVKPAASLWYSWFTPQPKPRGLHYTTTNKQGQTTDHWEAHFNLTPLKNALQHYWDFHSFWNSWNTDHNTWDEDRRKRVIAIGRAQRDLPAHIAQEYCHRKRNFEEVSKNSSLLDASNPVNLQRQLLFFNHHTGNYDLWFAPGSHSVEAGLGFSFAISRSSQTYQYTFGASADREGRMPPANARDDLAALTVLDKVRTRDCEQSLRNLSPSRIAANPSCCF